MKIQLFLLALVLPFLGSSQVFDINYDPLTNTMSVEYTGCDICLLGSQSAVNTCECRFKCEEDFTNDGYQQCKENCEEVITNPQEWADCIEDCNFLLLPLEECLSDCGSIPEAVRTIVGYQYILVAAWDEIPFDPRNNEDNWETFELPAPITSNLIDLIEWNPPSPWPGVYTGNNTCYGISMRIFYVDSNGMGVFCDHEQWLCNIIG